MVKMSTDPVAIMAGLLVWYKYNRHAHWSNAWVPSIPISRVQLYHTLLPVWCNKRTFLQILLLSNRHTCVLFQYHIICMRAGKNVWCDGLVEIHGCRSMKLQQIWLRTWYFSIRHVSFENQREKLLDWCPSIRHANFNCETLVGKIIAKLSMQDTCLLVQWDSIAMSLQLQQICILA